MTDQTLAAMNHDDLLEKYGLDSDLMDLIMELNTQEKPNLEKFEIENVMA